MSTLKASLRCVMLLLMWPVFIKCAKLRAWRGPDQFTQGSYPPINGGLGMTSGSDGKIYLFGGAGGVEGLYNTLWQYDPFTQTWTDLTLSTSGESPPPIAFPGFVWVNGKFYCFGGQGNVDTQGKSEFNNHLYQFDLATMAWRNLTASALGSPPLARTGYGSTTTLGDIIYIFGGYGNFGFANDLFQFDTVTMTWTELTDQISGAKPSERDGSCFTAVDGKLFIFGGLGLTETYSLQALNDTYVLDLSAKTWTELKGTGTPARRAALSCLTMNRKIYMYGGQDVAANVNNNELYEFDFSTLAWTNMASVMTVAEGSAPPLVLAGTGMALSGQNLYVFGGKGKNDVFYNQFYRWDFSVKTFYYVDGTIKGNRPLPRKAGGFTAVGSNLYLFAGASNNGSLNDMFRLDPETMIWTNLSSTMSGSVPHPRENLGFSSVGATIYVFGGKLGGDIFNDLHQLNISTMFWIDLTATTKGTAPTPRHSHGLIGSPQSLYVFGGVGSQGITNDFFELDIATMTWTNLTFRVTGDSPPKRCELGLAWALDNLYLFGGYGIEGLYHNDLLIYKPAESIWRNLQQVTSGTPPPPRSQHGFTAIGNKLFVFGGYFTFFAGGVTGSAFLGDLFMLDIETMAWTELTMKLSGRSPSPRCSFGFGNVGGNLFVFGGEDIELGLLNDVYAVSSPQQLMWPSRGNVAGFIPVFDFDTLIVDGEGTLPQQLELCVGVLPCEIEIRGKGTGRLDILNTASIACLASLGCSSVTLDSLKVVCDGSSAPKSLLRAQASKVLIMNCEISNCASQDDGGALQSFDNAVVDVQNSIFQNVSSAEFGGALSAVGSNMRVSNSTFVNCNSMSGGGAVASISYECYGSADLVETIVSISNSTFENCSSYGTGGAIMAASDPRSKANVTVDVETSNFFHCTAVAEGGAIRASGASVKVTVKDSKYTNCTSQASGGAVSIADAAATFVILSSFSQNFAAGTGGGGFHIDGGNLVAVGVSCSNNQAPNGGGGALFWEGSTPPKIFPWCQKGMWGSYNASCVSPGCMPSCIPCAAGKYLAEEGTVSLESCDDCSSLTSAHVCVSCESGKYSSSSGATECINCPIGQFTQSDGSSACVGNASKTRDFVTTEGDFHLMASSASADFCGVNNHANYGLCLASSYKKLEARDLPYISAPAYAGIAFTFTVVKKDFYDQDITSDSSSLLQTLTSMDGMQQQDSSVTLSGITIAALVRGHAVFSLSIRPRIKTLTPSQGIAIFERQPEVVYQGTDRTSLQTSVMQSLPYLIAMANGSSICPEGNVLILDRSGLGGCQLCAAGTYSIRPLAGPTAQIPGCLTCPPGAECSGGYEIRFLIGSWVAEDGMYRLIGCPAGYKLMNSISGAFAHDIQNCIECSSHQYIIDSNNSLFQCEDCPTGAVCDGSTLRSILAGSVWDANMETGTYVLLSCPPGYVVQAASLDSQQCSAWTASLFVSLTVALPMSLEEFNTSRQLAFQKVLATLASTSSNRVVIASIKQGRRSSPSIQVVSNVAATNSSAAADIAGKLNLPALAVALSEQGLPPAVIVAVVIVDSNQNSAVPLSLPVTVGSSLGAFMLVLITSVGGIYFVRRLQAQAEHNAFLLAFKKAQPGCKATGDILPPQMRKHYLPETIVGRGAFGVVIGAKSKTAGSQVAIKIMVPCNGAFFDDQEQRQQKREAMVLEMLTKSRCPYAVHLTGVDAAAVQFKPKICWFVMDWLDGVNMETVLSIDPISDLEIIKLARSVLAALKEMHAEGLVHRDVKPANIVRTVSTSSKHSKGIDVEYTYKLVDFGTALGVDERIAKEAMMTLTANRNIGVGTPPYMSPEMFKEPEKAMYPTDLWSLGVSLFQLATGRLPFSAENECLWSFAVAGNMDEKPPHVLDVMQDSARSIFDNNLAKVISKALEKRVVNRFQSADEMHEAIYCCLVYRGEAFYSAFISYRVASEQPVAQILFDELNHALTPGGHRVTIYWDAHRLVKGEDWEEGFANGLLKSLCVFPILSYGATAPLAAFAAGPADVELLEKGWEEKPCGRERLRGRETDPEDNVLKELMIASALLERKTAEGGKPEGEKGLLQVVYPLLVGRQHPLGHPKYPGMDNFFHVQGGGGKYPPQPSPPTNCAVARFLEHKACLPPEALKKAENRSVLDTVQGITALQGCELWKHTPDLMEMPLSKEQSSLIGKGYVGPPVADLDGVELTEEQRKLCRQGFDERQLRLLKAQIRAKRNDFYDVIDRAVEMCSKSGVLTQEKKGCC